MSKPAFVRGAALLTAFALTLSLAACGDNEPASAPQRSGQPAAVDLPGEYAGSGASSQQSADEAWIASFHAGHPSSRISYDPAGSGAGVTAFLSGAVVWAGTDEPLTQDQVEASRSVCATGSAFDLPVYATPIAFAYNLPSAGLNQAGRHLKMDPATVARIFDGRITRWNDPRLVRLNPGVDLPDLPITVIHRSDKSGTTKSLTSYLKAAAGDAWPHKPGENWPNDVGQGAKGTSGLVMTLTQAEGTFGYADAAQTTGLGTVAVKVGEGYEPASAKGAAKALDHSSFLPQPAGSLRQVIDVDYASQTPGAYPVLLVSYDVVCQAYKRDPDRRKATFAKAWLTYLASEDGQAQAASNAGSAPLSPAVRERIMGSVRAIEGA
ncbi:phosphate ABC transporter periplasmic protein [Bifidobacterium actinocoloniiforme DSM 22766]|uniref:Phosphate-binding protein n=1 Tax=Bifidobacterium actinocoloniiforme DSM 22766 TaxID=1437605 RepID=A0A086Z220_9BIFI|nr:phosphate ABC transporter substrate-binding protein PstS [Bifidobacterium actinocoloniiforme]AKV55999.1 phosphate ABC transporter substrate-binding protein [Bifidobacterium actinocoloniiforme DSM 22766]KFI40570.1 phosphate ABC transporter periplasmic protein [Bifidobacterium actinocoloniiforme DSM 22766]